MENMPYMCTPNTSQSSDCFPLLIVLLYTLHETTFEVLFKVYWTTINIVCVRFVSKTFGKKKTLMRIDKELKADVSHIEVYTLFELLFL